MNRQTDRQTDRQAGRQAGHRVPYLLEQCVLPHAEDALKAFLSGGEGGEDELWGQRSSHFINRFTVSLISKGWTR